MRKLGPFGLGVALSIVAVLFFNLMGAVIKHLSGPYGPAELAAYRNLFGLVPAAAALWLTARWRRGGRRLAMRQWPLAVLRGVAVTGAQFCFYLSLTRMEFAAASTITYSSAIFTTAFAAPIVAEKVGPVRWAAVMLGFAGVVMVMRPGADDFNSYAVLPLIASALYAFTGVTARIVDEDTPSPLFNLYSSTVAALGALAVTLALGGFSPIRSAGDFGWIVLMGGFGGCAVLCWVVSYRVTESSNLAPFNYLGIPISFALGWLLFGEAPFEALFPGGALIALSGLIIVWRERRRVRREAALKVEAGA